MNTAEAHTTLKKALHVNLDARRYGTFAEIGAGQEVVRCFTSRRSCRHHRQEYFSLRPPWKNMVPPEVTKSQGDFGASPS